MGDGSEPRPLLPWFSAHCIASSKYLSFIREAFNEHLSSVCLALPSPTRCVELSLSHCASLKARTRGRRERGGWVLCLQLGLTMPVPPRGHHRSKAWSLDLHIQEFDFISSIKDDETLGDWPRPTKCSRHWVINQKASVLMHNEKRIFRWARICFYSALKPFWGNFLQEETP